MTMPLMRPRRKNPVLRTRQMNLPPWARGRTALLDAIALGLREVKKSTRPRKAIVILSGGGDNRSRLTERELRSMARESDALIYAMGIFEGMGIQLSIEELAGPGLLEEK